MFLNKNMEMLLLKKSSRLLFFLWISSLFLLQGCTENPNAKAFKQEELTNLVTRKAATRIHKELGLVPFGTGGKARDQVEMLALAFQLHRKVDIEEGRKLLIASINIFLDEVNKEERIRPYLANVPFEPKNIEVEIFVDTFEKDDLKFVVFYSGALRYKLDVAYDELPVTIHKETYEEALQKISAKSSDTVESGLLNVKESVI